MVEYEKPTERPAIGVFYGFDHLKFHVGNAKQAASFYTSRFGFEYVAYQGLETGSRDYCTHVISNGKVVFALTSPLNPGNVEFAKELEKHGDGIKDVAFSVDDAAGIYNKAVERGAKSVKAPETMKDDNGSVIVASVQTYGDTIHTFVQRVDYTGPFLPGFRAHHLKEKFNDLLTPITLEHIDHVVGN